MSLTTINSSNIFQKDVIGRVRTAQEDNHDIAVLTPNGDLFVVCDGMGGHVGGQKASEIAVESILEYLKKEKYPNPRQALNEALKFANMQILGYASDHPELKGMGTTACILLLQDDEAYIAHVGDSRIYLHLGKEKKGKKERKLIRITKDHSWVQSQVDLYERTNGKEGMPDSEAEHHPNKNRILNALGIKSDLQLKMSDISEKPILPKNGDVFLICSDGLNGMISDSTIESILSENTTIEQKGEELIKRALDGENGQPGGQDNITVQLIQIDNSPHNKREYKHCDFNPKFKGKSKSTGSSSNSGKRIKILKWAIAAIIVLAIGYGGFKLYEYFYNNYTNIENRSNNITNPK